MVWFFYSKINFLTNFIDLELESKHDMIEKLSDLRSSNGSALQLTRKPKFEEFQGKCDQFAWNSNCS